MILGDLGYVLLVSSYICIVKEVKVWEAGHFRDQTESYTSKHKRRRPLMHWSILEHILKFLTITYSTVTPSTSCQISSIPIYELSSDSKHAQDIGV